MRRQRRNGAVYAAIGAVLVLVVVSGVGLSTNWFGLSRPSTAPGSCPANVELEGAGANFLLALMTSWESSYTTATANQVAYNPDGAGAGIGLFSERAVDFAATDEPLNASETAGLPGVTLTLPVTGGAVAIIYNLPGFTGPLELSGAQIAEIYLGNVTNWDSPALASGNPGLPDHAIVTVHRLDSAGTTYVLTNLLSDDSAAWARGPGTSIQPTWPSAPTQVAEKGNSALAAYVAETPYTIGYVDLADAVSSKAAIASIENPAGHYIAPSVANTQAAINNLSGQAFPPATGNWANVSFVNSPGSYDYPLATLSYFLVLENQGAGYAPSLVKAQVVRQWVDWTITSGQEFSAGLYYVEPPATLLTQDAHALNDLTYNGASIPACTT